jgi:transposase
VTERKKYTAEFKQRAVDLVIDSGRPIAQVSVDIGVNEGTLGNWVRKYRQEHPEAFANDTPESVAYSEHQRVLKENAKLKQEVEFLSKVSAFFASKQQS